MNAIAGASQHGVDPLPPSAHLRLERVSVVYEGSQGRIPALSDIGLTISESEFVVVVGPSGCGKSTLLRLLSGLRRPSQGRIVLAGEEIVGPRPDIGIVFQQPTLLPWKTILKNVLVPIDALGRKVGDYRQKALDLLKLVGLNGFENNYPNELSGGMQQRVGIARGLIHEPRLLLMDEPFAALDAMTRESMMVELQRIWLQEKKTVVFITHSIAEAVFLADRIIVLSPRPGRIYKEVVVDIARPRKLDAMSEPRFAELSKQLRDAFDSMEHENAT